MPSLRALVFENWALKLTALLLAFLMWLAVASEQFVRRVIFNVGLDFRNMPESMEIVGPISSKFDVELLTPIKKNILDSDVAIVIDLAGSREGNRIFPLGPESVRAPDGVEALRVNPSRLVVTLERTTGKEVPVQPRLEGSVSPGYEVGQVSVRPGSLSISGPRSRVSRITNVTTEAIDLTSRTSAFVTSVNVVDEGATVRIDRLEPVEVAVEIREQRRTVQVHKIPLQVRGAAGRYRIRPAGVSAVVNVPASLAKNLKADHFVGILDLEGLALGNAEHEVAPRIVLREQYAFDIQVLAIDPPIVRVRLLPP